VFLVAKTLAGVKSSGGMRVLPDTTMEDCPDLVLICVSVGEVRHESPLYDAETLAFLRRRALSARYITSVCSGALVLDAAKLL